MVSQYICIELCGANNSHNLESDRGGVPTRPRLHWGTSPEVSVLNETDSTILLPLGHCSGYSLQYNILALRIIL